MSVFGGPDIVTDGLVLHLDAANRKSYPGSGSTWYDLSDNTNDVTLYNGPTFSNDAGGCLSFDGTNDYGINSSPNNFIFSGLNEFTAATWMKVTPNGYDFWFTSTDIKYRFGSNSAGTLYWDMGRHADKQYSYQLVSGQWYQVVFVGYIQTYIKTDVYINGEYKTTITDTNATSSLSSINTFHIGTGETNTYHFFKGSIASVKIHRHKFTADEIAQNYNALKGRYGL
jgi:hypothetical protein